MPHKHFDKLKIEKLPNAEAQVTGEITLQFLVECRAEAVKSLGERVNIPGFRAGHIPEDVLVKNVGEMKILEETAEVALGQEYENIVKESKLSPLGRPHVSITKLAPGIPLEFKITLALEPEFTLPDYKKVVSGVKNEDKDKRRLEIIEALVKATHIALPKMIIEAELNRMIAEFKHDVAHMGAKWEDYLKSIKKTDEDVRNDWRDKAETRVKAELIMAKIAETEKIEPTLEELEKEANHIFSHHKDADPMRVRLFVYQMIKNQKVLEFIEKIDK